MNYQTLVQQLDEKKITLVAVSKTQPEQAIRKLYDQGQRDFGENRVSEVVDKEAALPDDIRWHFIGHLQRNKVKAILPFVHLIHSVDSARLLQEVGKQAAAHERVVDVLLQFHIAKEESKYGLTEAKARQLLSERSAEEQAQVRICGVMGMATYTDNETVVREEFRRLREIFLHLQRDFFADQPAFKEISMGMSGDYSLAMAEGSTMVRIGSLLFGERK